MTIRSKSGSKNRRRFQSETMQFLYNRYVAQSPERVDSFEQEMLNAEIARKIYEFRTAAGLSQRELAEKVGTSASAICRLESADYDGHSLSMLKRIAGVFNKRIEIRFVSLPPRRSA